MREGTAMNEDLKEYMEFARETALRAGEITLEYFQKNVKPDRKKDGSPVTIADRRAEAFIRQEIEKHYPSHDILGEEMGVREGSSGHRWIIDPIDGTQSFIHGVPLYGMLIGLEIDGRVEVGVANFPALNEIVYAATGLGCWWNGQRASVSQVTRLQDAVVCYTDIGNFKKYGGDEGFQQLSEAAWYRPGWGDAYGYMLVATGRAEVMLDPIMAVWDCAPFPPILREADGYFGDWEGNETIYGRRSVATSKALLPQVLAALNHLEG